MRSTHSSGVSFMVSEVNLRGFRRLVGAVDACEVDEFAAMRLGVEALGVAPFAFFNRSVDEHLDEFAGLEVGASQFAFGAVGADERAR